MGKNNHYLKKAIILFLAIYIFTTLLFSTSFISRNIHHNCTGKHCTTCKQIEFYGDIVKTFSFGIDIDIFIIYVYINIILLIYDVLLKLYPRHTTLVDLKVRLDN